MLQGRRAGERRLLPQRSSYFAAAGGRLCTGATLEAMPLLLMSVSIEYTPADPFEEQVALDVVRDKT